MARRLGRLGQNEPVMLKMLRSLSPNRAVGNVNLLCSPHHFCLYKLKYIIITIVMSLYV